MPDNVDNDMLLFLVGYKSILGIDRLKAVGECLCRIVL
jgi:hypothetical protein